jgi:1,4-alpha-glucan branching enzyme
MPSGYLSLILHCHLPFVRHPEYEYFSEENWLYEAISETYLPLLRVFRSLENDNVPFKLTVSISPTLAVMLQDPLLQERYIRHLSGLMELAELELERTKSEPEFHAVALMYRDLWRKNHEDFVELYERNILKGFDFFAKRGRLELITTAATHAYLPLYERYPETMNAQISTAVTAQKLLFGRRAKGFWPPEFGYSPGLEAYLDENDLEYFFTSAHGVLFADRKPRYGVYAPIRCPNGVAVFARDLASANAVWSPEDGYPGDISYREFYRDIGFDLPMEYIGPFLHTDGVRIGTGFKYYSVTGKTDTKEPYRPDVATRKAYEHAGNFLYNRQKQVDKLRKIMDRPPIIVSPYDAELFGHWWFEGPQWIEFLFRRIDQGGTDLELITPSEYLKLYPENQTATPSFSSWGNKGYSEVWLDGSNDWIYRHTHKIVERMIELAERFPDEQGLKRRALDQAVREVLLSQASDWPFIIKTGTTVGYAERRVKEHVLNFTRIYESLCRNTVSTEWLTKLEKRNNIFPSIEKDGRPYSPVIDYRIFRKRTEPVP